MPSQALVCLLVVNCAATRVRVTHHCLLAVAFSEGPQAVLLGVHAASSSKQEGGATCEHGHKQGEGGTVSVRASH